MPLILQTMFTAGTDFVARLVVLLALTLPALPASAAWRLVWNDEFNGTAIAGTNWIFDTGNGGPSLPGWGNNEREYYTSRSQNAFVTNGSLHIVAQRESYAGFDYTSAKVKTLGRFSQKYGRLEFRARLPQGLGFWPALWLLPAANTYGGWAASGEIDVMENRGSEPRIVGGTLHYGGSWPQNVHSGKSFTFPQGESVTNFHVYGLEWRGTSFRWLVDGQPYQTQTSWWSAGGPYPAPFNQPFYIIMNLAVGGNYLGNPSVAEINANTPFPGTLEVDYVRVYEEAEQAMAPLRLEAAGNGEGGLVLHVSNGIPNAACIVNGSTNLTEPVLEWNTVAMVELDGSGRITMNLPAAGAGMFYHVLVP